MWNREAVATENMAHTKSLFGPRKAACLLEHLNGAAEIVQVHNDQLTPTLDELPATSSTKIEIAEAPAGFPTARKNLLIIPWLW